jgi:hypothetical protein
VVHNVCSFLGKICRDTLALSVYRDDSIDTYWQSDGPQPHLVNIQFHHKVVSIYPIFSIKRQPAELGLFPERISDFFDLDHRLASKKLQYTATTNKMRATHQAKFP